MTWKESSDGEEWKEEEPQDPDTLINKKIGEVDGCPICVEDFAAWDFRHRNCKLKFEPLFIVDPTKSRIPNYMGMLITCEAHKEKFTRHC